MSAYRFLDTAIVGLMLRILTHLPRSQKNFSPGTHTLNDTLGALSEKRDLSPHPKETFRAL
jgi:hypothetical protein